MHAPRTRARWAVLAAALLASASLIGWQLHRRASARPVDVVPMSASLRELYLRRARETAGSAVEPGAERKLLVREPLEESLVRELYPTADDPGYQYDRELFVRHAPNVVETRHLPEHPGGEYELRTNSLGLREDRELLFPPPELRVLVTGASNVDGVCANASTATHVLERLLYDRRPERSVEALNAGVATYNFYNYLAVLERFRELRPDVFVVIAYGGTDFYGGLKLARYFGRWPLATDGPHSLAALETVEDRFLRSLLGTELAQVAHFLDNPGELDPAIDVACAATAEMELLCRSASIRPICVYLPPPLVGQPAILAGERARAMQLLALDPAALEVSDRIADQWLDFCKRAGIATLDLRPAFRDSNERLYWVTDTHLNLRGQELVARELLPLVEAAAAE